MNIGQDQERIKLIVVDDDPDFLYLIQKTLKKYPEFDVIGSCDNADSAVSMVCRKLPDIVLMDLDLGNSFSDGIRASREIRIMTDAKVLILTAIDSPDVILKACQEAFASGYIFKGQQPLLAATILELSRGYTAQEYVIAQSALACLSEAELAVFHNLMGKDVQLQSSRKTIQNQTTSILKKLGLENKKDLLHVFQIFRVNP
ncbi:MAG: response regulator transcription factor [Lachnospiraceae bacterium]|nr:response regulator transcription factor [Lachnospiraceae bacterium]